jgi:hypothetical protein
MAYIEEECRLPSGYQPHATWLNFGDSSVTGTIATGRKKVLKSVKNFNINYTVQ